MHPCTEATEWQVWQGIRRLALPELPAVELPSGLQSISFGFHFNQASRRCPSGLQNISFGENFNQSIEKETLPSGLQSISFGFLSTKAS